MLITFRLAFSVMVLLFALKSFLFFLGQVCVVVLIVMVVRLVAAGHKVTGYFVVENTVNYCTQVS